MTAAVPRFATADDRVLLDGYAHFCHELEVSDRALRERLGLARDFLARHSDLDTWMADPTRARLADLSRIKAWPFLSWAALSGRIQLDLDLLCAKNLGSMSATVRQLEREDVERLWERARRLGWSYSWSRSIIDQFLPAVLAFSGSRITGLSTELLEDFERALGDVTHATATTRRQWSGRLFGLRQLLFEDGHLDAPPQRRGHGSTIEQRLSAVPATEIRRSILRYLEARSAVLSQSSVEGLLGDLLCFGCFLGERFPELTSLRQLDRGHVEAFLTWNRTRTWRGRVARDQRVSPSAVHAGVLSVRNFLDDITLWGWAERPPRRLLFAADVPRLPRPLPRALSPDIDSALMAAVARLEDGFARCAILLLRRAGLRLGECLDLELSCVVDYGPTGTWLRVPLGKLGTERSVPLDAETVNALDAWTKERGPQRAHLHPKTQQTVDYLFAEHGRPLGPWRVRKGLHEAARAAGLTGSSGVVLNVTPHQLRHTYATELANAGMSLQALMSLLGHVTPEMTLRYATLASPTLRSAYDAAIGTLRASLPPLVEERARPPSQVDWLASELLKTRLGTGTCSRHLAAGPCAYANVCETCDNFVPQNEAAAVLLSQLEDVHALRRDARERGWDAEAARHDRVATALEAHLADLEKRRAQASRLDAPVMAG
ncbi:MAG: tyrosine-type recombinase/integrase [Acidimicrobiales bacterium]